LPALAARQPRAPARILGTHRRVRFVRSFEQEGELEALSILASQVVRDEILNTGGACNALALECRARLKLLEERRLKSTRAAIEYAHKKRFDGLQEGLAETRGHARSIIADLEQLAEGTRHRLDRLDERVESYRAEDETPDGR
jgi:hypothetical protein